MDSPPELWDGVLRRLGSETAPVALEAWLHPLAVREESERLVLLAPTAFHRERVRARFAARIRTLIEELHGRPLELCIEVLPGAAGGLAGAGAVAAAPALCAATPLRPALRIAGRAERAAPRAAVASHAAQLVLPCTFETFVTGPQNALAREASLALARGRQPGLFPLFLAGSPGTGKSHLARAVVTEARRHGVERAIYVSAERFITDFTSAVRARHGSDFRRRYRQECDLLVLEDVQFLAGKRQTQLELFHVVEHLRAVGARVLLTGDALPRLIPELSPRLASQMGGGLVAELELPDRTQRRAILRDRASRGGVALPDDCLEQLVDGVRGSVRDLEGVLTQLVASASLLGRPIDRELTDAALRKVSAPHAAGHDPEAVIACVAAFFGVSRAQLASRSRGERFRHPRQLAMYLCRRYTDASLSEIGRSFGRGHAAVANAAQKVERAILERAPLRYQVEELAARLEGRREASPRLRPKAATEAPAPAPDRARPGSAGAR
jgi:chromosomal replication initiator protein